MRLFILMTWIALTGASAQVASGQKSQTVTLHGKLLNFGSSAVLEDFSELQYIVAKSHHQVIDIKEDNSFYLQFPLNTPGYYRLGRNKLYLSPGDELEVLIDHGSPDLATFKGKGNIANKYLRNTPFPKGGSYLEAGKNIKETPFATLEFIQSVAKARQQELKALKGVSNSFKLLEQARIKADIIKSINSVPSYSYNKLREQTETARNQYVEDFTKLAKPIKDSLLAGFVNPLFLQIEVYRDIYEYLPIEACQNKAYVQTFQDWDNALKLATQKIKPQNEKAQLPAFRNETSTIVTLKYRDALNHLLDEKMKFGNGDEAKDFVVRTSEGTTSNLSSLRGKVIYIDLWATWCGPCLAEMPFLETLKEKYKENNDVAIVSLSIDDNDNVWLRDLEKRKPGGIQWRINRSDLVDYEVVSVPRYILIDRSFKIADMNAPRASEPQVTKFIEAQLTNQAKRSR